MPLDTQTLCRYRLERAAEDLLTAQHNHQSGFYKASIQSVVQRRFRKTVEKCQIISRYFKNVFAKKEIRPETCLSIPGLQFYLCSNKLFYYNHYSTASIETTIFIPAIDRSGTAVANKQAAIETTAASMIDRYGTAVSCRLSDTAAFTNMVQIYPSTPPITDAMIP